MTISIIGTGNVATNLGTLIQNGGYTLVFGSKNQEEDQAKIDALFAKPTVVTTLETAAEQGDVVIFAIPYGAVRELAATLKDKLAGKIVVDLTNPLQADWSPVILGAENSSGEETAALLPGSSVVKAFNTIFANVMKAEKQQVGNVKITAFICGNDESANQTIAGVAADCGFAPLVVGDIKNARYLEAMAHLNIQIAVGRQGGTDAAFTYFQR